MPETPKMNWKTIKWEDEYRSSFFDLKFWLKRIHPSLWLLRVKHPEDKGWRTVGTVGRICGNYELMRNAKQYAWNYHKSRRSVDA
jgi:hypothetical protein